MIEIKGLIELILVTLIIKLIVSQWTPPLQKSLQAIIAIVLGTLIGIFVNPTKDGAITGVIASGFAFYGGELIRVFKDVSSEVSDLPIKKIK